VGLELGLAVNFAMLASVALAKIQNRILPPLNITSRVQVEKDDGARARRDEFAYKPG